MICELLFSYEKEIGMERIINYLNTVPNPSQIITNDSVLHEFLMKKEKNSKMIAEVIPDDGPLAKEIFKKAKKLRDEYKNAFKDLTYKEIPVFSGFDLPLFRQLTILYKAEKILEEKINTIFIFSGFFDIFFTIKKKAQEMGYESTSNIGVIERNTINYLNFESTQKVENYQGKFARLRIYNFLKYSFGTKPSLKKIKISVKSGLEFINLVIKRLLYSTLSKMKIDSQKLILKKVKYKIKSKQKSEIIFFVTTSREDLYLNPWYPVFNLLKKNSIPFQIFTGDLATSLILSKENISSISFFEDVQILEKEIMNNKDWKNLNFSIKKILFDNVSIFGINELTNYLLCKLRRSFIIISILDIIILTSNLKSIVAIADGEMLENIAVEYAKKNNIQSFSLLPGYISPQPLLAEWFKVNKIFVHGLDGLNSMLELGYDRSRLLISGNPKYDFLKTLNSLRARAILKKQYHIEVENPLIVIAMARWHKDDELWMSDFIKYCNKNNFQVIIKIHPVYKSETRELSEIKLEKISKNCKNMKYLHSYDIDMHTLLSAADLIITDFSNVGIETILLDKPLLTVNLSKESFEYVLRYHEYGAAVYLENYYDLEKIVTEIFINKIHLDNLSTGRKKIIELINYQNDGAAGKRIFNSLIH